MAVVLVPAETVIIEVALCDGAVTLVATTATGFCEGADAGATYVTLPAEGPAGVVHGLEPDSQIWPMVVLPLARPFTVQVTFASAEPVTVGVRLTLPEGATVAVAGWRLIDTLFTRVTEAAALPLAVEARIVTAEGDGIVVGAV